MIRNETEYKKAVERVEEESKMLEKTREHLKAKGLTDDEVKRVIDPIESFYLQLREEVESYEKLKRGEFEEMTNLGRMGSLLISLRIYLGLSQTDLAERLGVNGSQVSRDERNEYHGITLDRAKKILESLGVKLHTTIETPDREVA